MGPLRRPQVETEGYGDEYRSPCGEVHDSVPSTAGDARGALRVPWLSRPASSLLLKMAHALAREVAEERARTEWRRMGARSEHEALGIFVHDVHRRWGSVFWRSWARVIRGRLPAIGRPNAEILHHGPPPAYARGQVAVGGAEPWPQVHPARHRLRGVRAAAGL